MSSRDTKNKGRVVSVTTDGFITDIENLELILKTNYLLGSLKRLGKICQIQTQAWN